jgi:hypothetical protein
MATGFESYVTLMTSSPASALTLARQHMQALMEKEGARVGDAGTSYDPSTLAAAIDRTAKHIETLEQAVNNRGLPFFVPFRRVN